MYITTLYRPLKHDTIHHYHCTTLLKIRDRNNAIRDRNNAIRYGHVDEDEVEVEDEDEGEDADVRGYRIWVGRWWLHDGTAKRLWWMGIFTAGVERGTGYEEQRNGMGIETESGEYRSSGVQGKGSGRRR